MNEDKQDIIIMVFSSVADKMVPSSHGLFKNVEEATNYAKEHIKETKWKIARVSQGKKEEEYYQNYHKTNVIDRSLDYQYLT